jgi:hypothetical protein
VAVHDETAAKLAHAEAVRRISGQMQVLAGVRTRAGALFGAASLATSFLSSVAAKAEGVDLGPAGWTAIGLFVVATVMTMLMFVSRGGLSFTIQREENEQLLAAPASGMTAADTYREFARRLERNYAQNADAMRWYFRGLMMLCVTVGAELVLWTLDFLA